jgi:hypothetical protein
MNDEPDFTVEYTADLCSAEQLAQIEKLKKFGWKVSHLWERSPGEICPWLIAKRPRTDLKKSGFVHCYLTTDGTMNRFEATLRNLT